MKRTQLLSVLILSFTFLSCQKENNNEVPDKESNFTYNQTNATTFGVSDVITMDETGDYIQSPYNTIRNNTTCMLYPTIEQGSGYTGRDVNGKLIERPLVKSTTKRTGTYGLSFDLPKRDATITYDQNDRDRLESTILLNGSLSTYSNEAHYSGFSLYISSGKDLINDWFVIHQWHQSSPESPPIAFELLPNHYSRLGVIVRRGLNKNSSTYLYLTRQDNTSGDKYIDLPRDKWIDFVVRWKFDVSGNNGELKVYRHDIDASSSTLIFDYNGQIGYSNVSSTLINEKFGIYRKADYVGSHHIFYDQLKVGDSFNDVKPW